jgi:hypothetical protein
MCESFHYCEKYLLKENIIIFGEKNAKNIVVLGLHMQIFIVDYYR